MVNRRLVDEHMEKLRSGCIKRMELCPDALKWTPLVSSQSLLEEEKNTEDEVIQLVSYYIFLYKEGSFVLLSVQ